MVFHGHSKARSRFFIYFLIYFVICSIFCFWSELVFKILFCKKYVRGLFNLLKSCHNHVALALVTLIVADLKLAYC